MNRKFLGEEFNFGSKHEKRNWDISLGKLQSMKTFSIEGVKVGQIVKGFKVKRVDEIDATIVTGDTGDVIRMNLHLSVKCYFDELCGDGEGGTLVSLLL